MEEDAGLTNNNDDSTAPLYDDTGTLIAVFCHLQNQNKLQKHEKHIISNKIIPQFF
jgi:hypothetical protein